MTNEAWQQVQRRRGGGGGNGGGGGGQSRIKVTCPRVGCTKWLWADRLTQCGFRCHCGATYSKSLASLAPQKPVRPNAPQPQGDQNRPGQKRPAPTPLAAALATGKGEPAPLREELRKELVALLSEHSLGMAPSVRTVLEELTKTPKPAAPASPIRGLQQACDAQLEADKAVDKAAAHVQRLEKQLAAATEKLAAAAKTAAKAAQEVAAAQAMAAKAQGQVCDAGSGVGASPDDRSSRANGLF